MGFNSGLRGLLNLVSMKLAKLHEFGQASLKTNFAEVTIFLVLSK
jgi:hypothetical protein